MDPSTNAHQEHTVLSLLFHAFLGTCSFLCTAGRCLLRRFPCEATGVTTVVWLEAGLSVGALSATGVWDVVPVITVTAEILGVEKCCGGISALGNEP